MKIVVMGATGLIGKKMVPILERQGHVVVAGSRANGIDAVSGIGLAEALSGADVIVDVTNSPSLEEDASMHFFSQSATNLVREGAKAGVKHIVALSIVGTAGLQQIPYFRAKQTQEDLIAGGSIPYTIVQATQFFELLETIGQLSERDGKLHLATIALQPISSDDVARILCDLAVSAPNSGRVEVAGPELKRICDFVTETLLAKQDKREIVQDDSAGYFGYPIDKNALVPTGDGYTRGDTTLKDWLCAAVK